MEYAPITTRARDLMADINWAEIVDHMHGEHNNIVDGDWLDAWHEAAESALDAIDAVHAALEHENATLREQADPSKVTLQVRPFVRDDDKAAALKPLEEAAEVYGAWQQFVMVDKPPDCRDEEPCEECWQRAFCWTFNHPEEYEREKKRLGNEIADTITACVNLAQRYGIDLRLALERVERANKNRGRYD